MKKRENEPDEIMNSLQNLERAKPSPDFERVLFQKLQFISRPSWMKWFRYGVAAMLVLGAINLYTLYQFNTNDQISTETQLDYLYENIGIDEPYYLNPITEE